MALTKIQAAGLTADLIDETKLADNSIDSEHYNDGSIDNAHLADDAVGIAELSATGTPSNTTYLRGDNTWTVPPDTNTMVGGSTGVDFNDNIKARFGTGNDLQIYASGNNSVITHSGDGDLHVEVTGSGEDLYLNANDDVYIRTTSNENAIKCIGDGAVELYHNGVKKLNTDSGGIEVVGAVMPSGNISMVDSAFLKLGASDDLKLHHNGTDNVIEGSQHLIVKTTDAAKKIYLQSDAGIDISDVGVNEYQAKFINDGAVELYYDGTKRFETNAYGAKVNGHLYLDDSHKVNLGSSQDLELYHDGSNSYIKNNTGWLNIPVDGGGVSIANTDFSENIARFLKDGACELYHNGTKKLQTESHGVTIDTNVTTTDFNSISNGTLDLNNTGDTADYWTSLFWKMGGAARFSASIKKHGSGSGADFYMHAGTTQFLNIHGDFQDIFIGNAPNWTATTNAKGMMFDTDNNGNHPFLTVQHASKTTGSASYINFESEGGVRGKIVESGSGNDVSYDSISDYRLKENISEISDGITRLKQLKPSRFNWKSDDTNTAQDGFIAHEVQTVVPSAVSGTKDEVVTEEGLKDGTYKYGKVGDIVRQSMDYGKVTPLITAALKEAITKIETLETKVAALEAV